ncbi:cobalt-precorrin-6A reductase [Microcoleus asticus]|uniref:Precorrin-6A reductase n=1 Tax=Microcoleus asticus IPMA8 TaxID=2563858 RepID=A0ABX2CZR3_9CYAN|nr:Precorrin-6A reductase [Microcoleus asticus IPMA8]
MKKRLLILGGTGDAAELAARVSQIAEIEVVSSLAGRTQQPFTPKTGTVRIGGFGGAAGLAAFLLDRPIDLLIDATHPFAAQISANAAVAAAECNVPYLMLVRPAWEMVEDDRWIEVTSHSEAAKALLGQSQRVFLTIGRQELAAFAGLDAIWFLMRAIDPPALNTPVPNGKLLLARGPFTLEDERELLLEYQIDTIVSKNSGGGATYAKIAAARELGISVVMVQRPQIPDVEQVDNVERAIAWLIKQLLVMSY